MRSYQREICQAIINRRNWGGSNVVVTNTNNTTKIAFYGHVIGIVDHVKRTTKCSNCGYNTASTTARINAVKMASDELGYKLV